MYKQGIGELIYALVTCRPDIWSPIIKLSQHFTKPVHIQFNSVKGIYRHLKDTRNEGIHYWQTKPRLDCEHMSNSIIKTHYNNYATDSSRMDTKIDVVNIQVDICYVSDSIHHISVIEIVAKLASGCISY